MQCLYTVKEFIEADWLRVITQSKNEEIYRNANISENGALWLANKQLKLTRTNQVSQLTGNFNMVWASSF